MLNQYVFEFILDTKMFLITSTFLNLDDVKPDIRSELIFNKRYIVKSHVTENVFQSFIDHWTKKTIPLLNTDNIFEYEQLSHEFDRMNDLIQLFHKRCSEYEQIKMQNYKLKEELPKKNKKLDKTYHEYQQTIFNLTKSSNFFTTKNKSKIYDAIQMNNSKKIMQLTQDKIILDGLEFALNHEDKTCCLLGAENPDGDIFVPYSVIYDSNEYIVTSIFQSAFHNAMNLKSIQFPDNSEICLIERYAFAGSSIEHIKIPDKVKKIGSCAFEECEQIDSVEISEDSELEIIGKTAFSCSSLKSIFIPSKVTHIKEKTFDGCDELENVDFAHDSQLSSIDSTSFRDTAIQDIQIPSHVTVIGDDSFSDCQKLINVSFSKDSEIEKIGERAFYASSLNRIAIPSSVKEIKEGWCQETTKLTEIIIYPTEEQNILYYQDAFILGKSDKTKNVYDILIFARRDVINVFIPSFITKIESSAFDKCEQIQSIDFVDDSQLQIFKEDIFSGCSLKSLTISSNVTTIKEGCFCCLPNLCQIKIMPNNRYFCYFDEKYILGKSDFYKDDYDVLIFARKDIQYALIPSFIKKIGKYAFYSCEQLRQVEFAQDSKLIKISNNAFENSSLISIKIPPHLKSIGKYALNHCEKLIHVIFSNDSELEIIKQNAFSYSCSLMQILIPPKVSRICDEAFCNCSQLKYIVFPKNSQLEFIGGSAFLGTLIKEIFIPNKVEQILRNTFMSCKNLQKVEFNEDSKLKVIHDNAFNSSTLEEISIPSSFVEFKIGWCHRVANVKKITVFKTESENITYYEDKFILGKSDLNNDFYDVLLFARRDINKVVIPAFIKQIAPFAFHECKKFQKVEFEDETSLVKIGENAFSCSNVESFVIPPNVENVEDSTFSVCIFLSKIGFHPNSAVKSIGQCAFWQSKISSICIPFGVTKINSWAFERITHLKIIEFSDNYEFEPINIMDSFDFQCIMIPAKFEKIFAFKF